MVGFSNGNIRVYTENGTLLLTQMFHDTSVLQIKCRTYENPKYIGWISQPEEVEILYNNNDSQINFRFKVGDYVRISIEKGLFSKGYETTWSPDIYIIAHLYPTIPPHYTIKDIENVDYSYKFYQEELQKIEFEEFPFDTFKIIEERDEKILVEKINSEKIQEWVKKDLFLEQNAL